MPVQQIDWELDLNLDMPLLLDESELLHGLPSPNEDVWSKFDLESSEAWTDWWQNEWAVRHRTASEIRVHDCMWAGTCLSKVHVARPYPPRPPRPLKKPPSRPDTPQSLSESEEEPKKPWNRGVAVSEVTGQRRTDAAPVAPPPAAVQFDHNYTEHKRTSLDIHQKHPRIDDLGVQTPSDSEEDNSESNEEDEEEIDVVGIKPSSPAKEKEACRLEETTRLVTWASLKVSRRLGAQARGRKRKRASSEEDETYLPHGRPRRKYPTPSKRHRPGTDSETDSTEKRSQHNNMERMRRIDLKNLFDDLRGMVPSLAESSKAAKVTVLRDATSYCLGLTAGAKAMAAQVAALRRDQDRLRCHLSKLRRHIASKHLSR